MLDKTDTKTISQLNGQLEAPVIEALRQPAGVAGTSAHNTSSASDQKVKTSRVYAEADDPMFLMNIPYSYSTSIANNAWMEELDEKKRAVDVDRAMTQFLDLYHFIAGDAVVYVLPTPVGCQLQDLVFTANLGVVLEHLPDREIVILSKMATGPRQGEPEVGRKFFEALGFEVYDAPFRFEGEAELKHLRDNIYLGGYGARTDPRIYDWMEEKFEMKIIRLEEVDRYCYHLDCSVFPLTSTDTMVSTSLFKRHELEKLGQFTNIIDVSSDAAYSGICNSVRLHSNILNASNLHQLKVGTEDYHIERDKNRELEDIAAKFGFEVAYFNLSEYLKGGALLSCMIMHLNRRSNEFSLT